MTGYGLRPALLSLLAIVVLASGSGQARAAVIVAEYTFSNAAALGLDSSGNGNNATILQNVSQGTGPSAGGSSAIFNQNSQFQIRTGLTGYTGVPGFSYSLWVDVSGASSGYNGLLSQDFGGCCVNRLLLASGTQPFVNAGAHNDTVPGGNPLPLNTWYNIVMTSLDNASTGGNNTDIYVNGTLRSTINYSNTLPNLSSAFTYLGAGENDASYRLSGALADVRIYQGALSSDDVTALYDAGAGARAGGTASTIPEPATATLLALGVTAIVFLRRHRWI